MAEAGKYKELFKPIKIGNVEIKNRIAMSPMCTSFGTHDGYVTEQFKAYYAARAKGGVGLILSGPVTVVDFQAKRHCNKPLLFYNYSHIPGMSEIAEIIHYFGAKTILQMGSGAGRQAKRAGMEDPTLDIISASHVTYRILPESIPKKSADMYAKRGWPPPMAANMVGEIPRPATLEEIEMQEDGYANTAAMARIAGFDGVEIHHAHGYFGYSFLSPRLNLRTDHYGGSLENRTRFMRNSLLKSKQKAGKDFVIGFRISIDELMPGGLTHEEVKQICMQMESLGADFINLSTGCYDRWDSLFPDEDGTMLDGAASIKKVVSIPVITPSVHNPDMAEEAIKAGKTDIISLGRGLLADPAWANKVAQGKKPVKCIRCNFGCLRRLLETGEAIRCEVNPELGFEQYNPEYFPKPPFRRAWRHDRIP